jgi:uncharacterized protein YfdQ (DUF2303 family)
MTDHTTEAAVVRDLTEAAAEPRLIETVPGRQVVLVGHKAAALLTVDLDDFAARPPRHQGIAHFDDPDSFVHYATERLGDPVSTGYYADVERLQVLAVFNDHGADPGWRDHRAVLRFRPTPEWQAWTRASGGFSSTGAFGDLVEDLQHTVLEPDAATVRDMVRNFRATQKVTFGDEISDKSGDRSLQWTVETQASGGRTGELAIPDHLTLQLAPFIGSEPTELVANFRYRLEGGKALFGVSLVQPDKLIRDAFANEVVELGEQLGSVVMAGTPAREETQ